MWRGWKADGTSTQTNRRYFFNAGWFWETLAYLADGRMLAYELTMIAPEFFRGVQSVAEAGWMTEKTPMEPTCGHFFPLVGF
jgi:hypothetical protein